MKLLTKKVFLPSVGCLITLLLWFILDILNVFDHRLIPTLFSVIAKTSSLIVSGSVFGEVYFTLYRALSGFVIAAVVAVPLGLILGSWKSFRQMFAPVIDFLRSLPGTAMFPLFLLLFGIGDGSKIATAAFLSFWVILINSIFGAQYVTNQRKLVAQSFGANSVKVFLDVTLREALPHIVVGLKTGLSLSLISVVISEMIIGSANGIGQRIYDSYISYETINLFAWIGISGFVGLLLNKAMSIFDSRLLHWSNK